MSMITKALVMPTRSPIFAAMSLIHAGDRAKAIADRPIRAILPHSACETDGFGRIGRIRNSSTGEP
ncbi:MULTISPECIES: hypothetical protein [unclassified Sphingomonas]|uniref:hypothetical protein n=1 Tax=unclassified Sphingomonas TaxID=196159 RepID=UPI002861D031|nr:MULTISPECIES: hypothetical protein [unclassified Sphingomonas]MDR6113393.1 hypothetical protein [Sphingomonas sp. SORGH_AS_0789]MDR6149246.1 hypothetical protein [Sphingomonas sp. SORGH_AS_0742]